MVRVESPAHVTHSTGDESLAAGALNLASAAERPWKAQSVAKLEDEKPSQNARSSRYRDHRELRGVFESTKAAPRGSPLSSFP